MVDIRLFFESKWYFWAWHFNKTLIKEARDVLFWHCWVECRMLLGDSWHLVNRLLHRLLPQPFFIPLSVFWLWISRGFLRSFYTAQTWQEPRWWILWARLIACRELIHSFQARSQHLGSISLYDGNDGPIRCSFGFSFFQQWGEHDPYDEDLEHRAYFQVGTAEICCLELY